MEAECAGFSSAASWCCYAAGRLLSATVLLSSKFGPATPLQAAAYQQKPVYKPPHTLGTFQPGAPLESDNQQGMAPAWPVMMQLAHTQLRYMAMCRVTKAEAEAAKAALDLDKARHEAVTAAVKAESLQKVAHWFCL